MDKSIYPFITFIFLITSCFTSKSIDPNTFSNEATNLIKDEPVGHIIMGLIEYELIDTINTSIEMAEMVVKTMEPYFHYEIVFNSTKSADLMTIEGSHVRRSWYDRKTKTGFEFLTKDSIDYISNLEIAQQLEDMEVSDEEMAKMPKMLKLNPYDSTGMLIHGLKCDEVTMMESPESEIVFSKTYVAKKIPHLAETSGPMSKFYSGAPIKTVVFQNGVKITFGAIEYIENSSMGKYLTLDKTKYQEIDWKTFELLKENKI